MTIEPTTSKQRRLAVGLAAVASSAALVLGIAALGDDNSDDDYRDGSELVSAEPTPPTKATPTTKPAPTTEPVPTNPTSAATGPTQPSSQKSATVPIPNDTDAAARIEGPTGAGSTRACRADPGCPSSEHRTDDRCGAAIIVDTGGYHEGRRDAEQGLAYHIDGAPSPEPAGNDHDGTASPETDYQAGYAQGWCDGGGTPR